MVSAVASPQAVLRGPSLTAPLTQNTAPVIEHRCLYTHDLRRKQKRWQDGLLRFHSFNKRVMVYDFPAGNFIGDSHWREDYSVQDGDELELDRPVLVQVGEQMGQSQQDLSELLAKRTRKPCQADPATRMSQNVPSSLPGSANKLMPTNVLQPKPLNEVLGGRTGKIGRAALPSKSPYESRRTSGSNIVAEPAVRPSKRPRIERAGDADASFARVGDEIQSPKISTDRHPSIVRAVKRQVPNIVKRLQQAPDKPSAIEIEDDGETIHFVSVKPERGAVPRYTKNVSAFRIDGLKESASRNTPESQKPNEDQSGSETTRDRKAIHLSTLSNSINSQKGITDGQERPTSRLQVTSRKPRRKLMYKDLLPPDAVQEDDQAGNTKLHSEESGSPHPTSLLPRHTPSPKQLVHTDNVDELDCNHARHHVHSPQNFVECGARCQDHQVGSSLLDSSPDIADVNAQMASANQKRKSSQRGQKTGSRNDVDRGTSLALEKIDQILASNSTARTHGQISQIKLLQKSQLWTDHGRCSEMMQDALEPSPEGLISVVAQGTTNQRTLGSDFEAVIKPRAKRGQIARGEIKKHQKICTLQTSTSLPNFVGPRAARTNRGPLKSTLSDSSILVQKGLNRAQPLKPSSSSVSDPWSKEAWDLFGCWRNGEVNYHDS